MACSSLRVHMIAGVIGYLDLEVSLEVCPARVCKRPLPSARPRPTEGSSVVCGGTTNQMYCRPPVQRRTHVEDPTSPRWRWTASAVVLTGGNVNDCIVFSQIMAGIEVRRPNPDQLSARPARFWRTRGTSAASSAVTCADGTPRRPPQTPKPGSQWAAPRPGTGGRLPLLPLGPRLTLSQHTLCHTHREPARTSRRG